METVARAQEALDKGDYVNALELAVVAAGSNPLSWKACLVASTACTRLKKRPLDALAFAEYSVIRARAAGKAEGIAEGQFRRAIALHNLGRYRQAREVLTNYVKKNNLNDKSYDVWAHKIDLAAKEDVPFIRTRELAEFPAEKDISIDLSEPSLDGDASDNKASPESVSSTVPASTPQGRIVELPDEKTDAATTPIGVSQAEAPKQSRSSTTQSASEYPRPQDVRIQYFQHGTTINVSIFIKNAPKDEVNVQFSSNSYSVSFPSFGTLSKELAHEIDPSKSTFRVFGTKIELSLTKAVGNEFEWKTFESGAEEVVNKPGYQAAFEKSAMWEKQAEKELEGYKEVADETNEFFKSIYADADDDTRKAMMKSYTESGGTSLSTNWADVSKGKVEVVKPGDI